MNLQEKVKTLPLSPGVYLMKDSLGNIIYIGKAKKLKNRVQSYFQNSKNHTQKVNKLVKNINDLDIIHTDTEFEALLLECQLIKEIKPFYNKKMKSPQRYPFIVIHNDKFLRRIEITTTPQRGDGTLIFGPYSSKNLVEKALQGIKEFYQIDCSNPLLRNSACLNYSLGLCIGMCQGGPAVEQYDMILNKMIAFFKGTDRSILEGIEQTMLEAAEKCDFEKAAKYRDYIDSINFLINREKVIEFTQETKNLAIVEPIDDHTIKFFLINGNKVLINEKYNIQSTDVKRLRAIISLDIVSYFRRNKVKISTEVTQDDIDEAQIIYSYLKSSSCHYIIIPEKWLDTGNTEKVDEALGQLLPH
jgi:excinuclease ABC subunit C